MSRGRGSLHLQKVRTYLAPPRLHVGSPQNRMWAPGDPSYIPANLGGTEAGQSPHLRPATRVQLLLLPGAAILADGPISLSGTSAPSEPAELFVGVC
ncbi:hypothetical protein NDU88_001435 [Pleurodeles waltl]|uniref:Uncharacterized protein n=1 Tax=Pleurodeles waltl TaxID=8319 RepID=A0AAV7LYN0_PLEWA|nr:hypothetical protein NDU88_001435 [Pleurodeles waltl]